MSTAGWLSAAVEKTCDGWVTSQDMAMQLETAQGTEVRQAIRYSGWESRDGKRYQFVGRSQTGPDVRRDSAGAARAGEGGAPGEAVFKQPEAKTVALPPGTKFPVAHAIWLIERALAGAHAAPSVVFDGTDGAGPQQVAVFIGKRQESSDHGKGTFGPLTAQAGWTMRLAFYPAESRDASPEYEMEVLQLVNGVAPRMLVDYREFSIQFDIREIEAVPEPKCQ